MSYSKWQTTYCAGQILKIRYSIRLRMSIIRNSTDALRMSNIRDSTNGRSNVENPTSEEGRFGCQIFDGGQYRIKNRIEFFCKPLSRIQLPNTGVPTNLSTYPGKNSVSYSQTSSLVPAQSYAYGLNFTQRDSRRENP